MVRNMGGDIGTTFPYVYDQFLAISVIFRHFRRSILAVVDQTAQKLVQYPASVHKVTYSHHS